MPQFDADSLFKKLLSMKTSEGEELLQVFLKLQEEGFFSRICKQQSGTSAFLQELNSYHDQQKSKPNILTLIFAGGKGSRLNKGAKALVKLENGKTLLQHLLDKIDGPVAVMCSNDNLASIAKVVADRNVHLFTQSQYPAFDLSFTPLFLDQKLVYLPSGNGESLYDLAKQRFFDIEFDHISICNIDNPLWNPQDPAFIDQHVAEQNEVTIATCAIPKAAKMGIICEKSPYIIEYHQTSERGKYGNMGAYLISKEFCNRLLSKPLPPLYPIEKTLDHGKKGYKLESFFFDCFQYAKKVGFCLFDAKKSFFPIKEKKDLAELFLLQKP